MKVIMEYCTKVRAK